MLVYMEESIYEKHNVLLLWLPGDLDKFVLFSSSGNDNVYSS